MLIADNYGYFRDELHYIVAGEHLSFGYVDFPPVIAFLAVMMNLIAGDSVAFIHVIPAIAGGAIVCRRQDNPGARRDLRRRKT